MNNQRFLIVLGLIGLVLASRIPGGILHLMVPRHSSDIGDFATNAANTGFGRAVGFGVPWIRIIGAILAFISAFALLIKSRTVTFRRLPGGAVTNVVIAIVIAGTTAFFLWTNPPKVLITTDHITEIAHTIHDGTTGKTSWDSAPRRR